MESGSVSAPEAATNAGTVTTPASSPSVPQWEGAVLARLDRFRRYPYAARLRQQEGVVYLRMTVGPHGEVLSSGVQRSSGIAALDEETKSLAARAAPLPAPPPELSGAPVELVVPIRYVLR
jgi:protein TonB